MSLLNLLKNQPAFLQDFWGSLLQILDTFLLASRVWASIPKPFMDHAFNDFVMWKDFRLKLWHEAEDPLLSKENIIKNTPEGISMDQWALYVNYRSKEKTKALCWRKQRIRQQQILPHTSGAMSLARRRALMKKHGKEVDRGKVWTETHERKDGSYVNDQAREIGERIKKIRRQRPETLAKISPNDALGVVFSPEHPGRVRGLGMGAVPTVVFKQTSIRGTQSRRWRWR
ncbi:uncharacterized protein LOC107765063 isoform X1 [Nicotiana tabacum]|uniref:Uncharacterized protein LOC107765063 isoform X1 n=14 Tax=Nicotiana tabacum TaxID=4097 RepID=A0AC58SUX6_TOBAC